MRLTLPRGVAEKMVRTPDDFEVQTFRSGGAGGQNQNKRDTGVRIIDRRTGLRGESREHRTQLANRKAAFKRLVDALKDLYLGEYFKDNVQADGFLPYPDLVIRTYKFPKGFVVDHRTGKKYPLDKVMEGELEPIHEDLRKIKRDE